MAQGMQLAPLESVREAFQERTMASSFAAFLVVVAGFAVLFELLNKPIVAALTVAFGIFVTILTVLFIVIPVSALSLLD